MGVIGPARRKHLAALSLTTVTLAVLAADLVFVSLNASLTSTARVGLNATLAAAAPAPSAASSWPGSATSAL
jgi:hypothetical protein